MKFENRRPPTDTRPLKERLPQRRESCGNSPPNPLEEWYAEFNSFVAKLVHAKVKNYHVAEEIIQQTWMKLQTSHHLFDPTKAQRATFLGQIIKSTIIDFYRRQGARCRAPSTSLLQQWDQDRSRDLFSSIAGPERQSLQIESSDFCQVHLAKLPRRYRLAMEAYYIHEVPIDRIAVQFGISIPTAHAILYKARRELYRLITGKPRSRSDKQAPSSEISAPGQEKDSA